jgi:RHS repeat-associated protein
MADPKGTAQCPTDFDDDDCPDLEGCGCCPDSSKNNDDTKPNADEQSGEGNVGACPPDGTKTVVVSGSGSVGGSTVTSTVPCDYNPCASANPIVYSNGAASIKRSNFGVRSYGMGMRDTLVYNNLYAGSSGGPYVGRVGFGWSLRNQPRLVSQDSGNTVLVYRGTEVIRFTKVGGVFQSFPYRPLRLNHDATGQKFYLQNTQNGSALQFNDFNGAHGSALAGQPTGRVSASGSRWENTLDSNGNVTNETMCPADVSAGDGAGTTSGGCEEGSLTPQTGYEFGTVGGIPVMTGSVLSFTDPDTGDTTVRKTEYTYYNPDESGKGSVGDLKIARVQVCTGGCTGSSPTWTTLKTSYFRYYTAASGTGFKHGLKFVLGPEAYQRATEALGGSPENATDTQLRDFADYYFEYDGSRRVSKERRFGYGTGSLTSTFAYTKRGGTEQTSYNEWQNKTVETKAESGKVITVYTNFTGQVLLRDVQSGSNHWYDYYEYDSAGRVTLQGKPSGITGYSQTGDGALSVTKNSSTGLFLIRAYYTSGAASGQLQYAGFKKGYSGTLVKQEELEWASESDPNGIVYVITKKIQYLTETDQTNSANQAVTTFAYEFHNNQVTKKTTTVPAVPTAQNGANVTNTVIEEFDEYGYLVKRTDGRNVVTVYEWNVPQGMLMRELRNYINPSTYIPVDYEYDKLGRVTKVTRTIGSKQYVKWIVYDDLNFERREARGYIVGGVTTRFNPATIYKFDRANRLIEVRQATDGTSLTVSTALTISTNFPQDKWVRWQVMGYNNLSQFIYRREYFAIPSSGSGSSGTNYNQTDFGYSATRDLNRIKSPGSTIRRMVYDARGHVLSTWVGTDDTGATDANPAAGSSNLVKVQELEWDGGSAGGDGNQTKRTDWVNASGSRVTNFTYDWRDRRETVTLVMASSPENIFTKLTYDNLSRVTVNERREGSVSGNLVSKQEFKFDKRVHLYQQITYPASGAQTLTANFWYDEAGNRIKEALPGSQSFKKTQYDNLRRVVKVFEAYGTDSTFAQVKNVSNNVVMRQTEHGYDDLDNLLQVITRERYHDETTSDLGELQTPTTSTHKARVICRALYYDELDRQTADVNYGTNGTPGTWSWTRPAAPAAYSTEVQQTRRTYDERGELEKVETVVGLAPASSFKRDTFEYDDTGRVTKQIENSAGSPTRTTQFEYNADGRMKKLIAWNATTGNQTTEWVYGVTPSNGSEFYNNDLVYQKILPDSASGSDRVSYGYNRQDQVIKVTDQNGNVHVMAYDNAGRFLEDHVSTLGSGVDGTVRAISAVYGPMGLTKVRSQATSGGTPLNDVEWVYNEWGQVTEERQEHGGATSGSSPKVVYDYENGSANNIRLKKLTHPTNTNAVEFLYGSASGQDDVLSRVKQLKWNGTVVTEYSHLGLDRTVVADYQQPDVKWNLVSGSGNYPYDGWDRYDRVINALWQYYGGSPANREQVLYGFNRANNRLWRQNTVAGTGQDEYYTYDGLFQVKTLDRGTLNGTKTGITGTPSWEEDWNYDETGNWRGSSTGYLTKAAGTTTLNQNRTHNVANEITDITESTGTAWPTPTHDGNGNLTKVPRPLDLGNSHDLKYDAWNRLVEVKNTGGATVATYRYDGFHRRVTSLVGSDTRHYYYSLWWQVLEERLNAGTTAERAFVWGLRYLDDLVLRQKSSERLYALHDYYSVTALVNTSGTVLERYGYDGFGGVRYMNASFGSASSSYGWETLYGAYRYDADTGLYQVRFRYLHPKLGRWSSRDLIGYRAGTNLYTYTSNTPVNRVDPHGLEEKKEKSILDDCCGTESSSGSDAIKDFGKKAIEGENKNPFLCILQDLFNIPSEWLGDKLSHPKLPGLELDLSPFMDEPAPMYPFEKPPKEKPFDLDVDPKIKFDFDKMKFEDIGAKLSMEYNPNEQWSMKLDLSGSTSGEKSANFILRYTPPKW